MQKSCVLLSKYLPYISLTKMFLIHGNTLNLTFYCRHINLEATRVTEVYSQIRPKLLVSYSAKGRAVDFST